MSVLTKYLRLPIDPRLLNLLLALLSKESIKPRNQTSVKKRNKNSIFIESN